MSSDIRVLVADDTPEIRLLVQLTLTHAGGFEVVGEAGDGRQALTAIEELGPDAVVLDLAMPVMDGLQVIAEVRERSLPVKILVVSGFDGTLVDQALALGADDYIRKGGNPMEIAEALRALCAAA